MAHLPGTPKDWPRDEIGRPTWITALPHASGGPWFRLIARAPTSATETEAALAERLLTKFGAAAMPRILEEHVPPDARQPRDVTVGRPRLERTDRRDILAAAWAADALGVVDVQLAAALQIGGRDERTRRRGAERLLVAGRRRLAGLGVLPWSCWPRGNVPVDWWNSPVFSIGLKAWFDCYIDPVRDVLRARERVLAAVADYERKIVEARNRRRGSDDVDR